MLLVVLAVAAGAAAGLALGRRPPGVDLWRLRRSVPALGIACAALLAGRYVPAADWGWTLTVAGYAALIAWTVTHRDHPGLMLTTVGLAADAAVVSANHGMPVEGLRLSATGGAGLHLPMTAGTHLAGLGDVIRLGPLGLTLSPGDVLVAVGALCAMFAWMETAAPRTGRRAGAPG